MSVNRARQRRKRKREKVRAREHIARDTIARIERRGFADVEYTEIMRGMAKAIKTSVSGFVGKTNSPGFAVDAYAFKAQLVETLEEFERLFGKVE